MKIENVNAVLKDIKVTNKGVTVAFENVKLEKDELAELSTKIGETLVLELAEGQLNIFEDENVNDVDPEEEGLFRPESFFGDNEQAPQEDSNEDASEETEEIHPMDEYFKNEEANTSEDCESDDTFKELGLDNDEEA